MYDRRYELDNGTLDLLIIFFMNTERTDAEFVLSFVVLHKFVCQEVDCVGYLVLCGDA